MAGGVFASKPRPALVVQDDRFDANDSLTVLPLTTTLVDVPLLRIPVQPSELSGLIKESHIMIDKLTTVLRANVQGRIGRLTPVQMVEVERALLVFLGIA